MARVSPDVGAPAWQRHIADDEITQPRTMHGLAEAFHEADEIGVPESGSASRTATHETLAARGKTNGGS